MYRKNAKKRVGISQQRVAIHVEPLLKSQDATHKVRSSSFSPRGAGARKR